MFWFTVNLEKALQNSRLPTTREQALKGVQALIVDDNSTSRETLERQLQAWHIDVASAKCRAEALEVLRLASQQGKPFQLAILDIDRPEMTSWELARAIRTDGTIAPLRLVLLSAPTKDRNPIRHAEDVDGYLAKPWRQSDLYDCLVTAMDRSAIHRVEAPGNAAPMLSARRLQGRVLLAEDNLVNQQVAVGMCEAIGLAVEIAANGCEALKALSQSTYDLILMDCHMPEMDGFQATAEIRDHEQRTGADERIPIIALTANALQGDRERCLAAGMDDYISKPFTQAKLRAVLTTWLKSPLTPAQHAEAARDLNLEPATGEPSAPVVVLDEAALNQIRALQRPGRPSVLTRVVRLYLDDSPRLIKALQEAVREGDAMALQKGAHTLKSSSANLGAMELASLCRELETLGREAHLENTLPLMKQLEHVYFGVREALINVAQGETA